MARYRFEFWLDKDKPEEADLMTKIDELKARNKFASTMRKGVVLIPALDEGDYETLVQMYPDVVERLLAAMVGQGIVVVNTPPAPPEPSEEIKSLKEQINQLTDIVLQQHVGKEMQSTGQPAVTNTKSSLNTLGQGLQKPIPLPVFEEDLDDLPTLVTMSNMSTDSSLNFVSQMRGLQ